MGPEVNGMPTSHPPTAAPQRRPAKLAAPIRAGVTTSFRIRLSTPRIVGSFLWAPEVLAGAPALVGGYSPDCLEGRCSRKSGPAVPSEARGARVGRTAQNPTPKIYLSVDAPPPVPQYHRRHPNGRRQ
jgi:hypothetical protein